MVSGTSLSRCSCGAPYITGDCIELDGLCPECTQSLITKNPCKEVDLTHLVSPIMKDALKREIHNIIKDALSGTVDIYRYKQDASSYIRWGIVEKHINETIDLYWTKEKENEG
jgi:hypothetical protein